MSRPSAKGDVGRELIATATIDLVAEHGYGAVGPETICAQAGLERRQFDRLFASMEHCFLSVYDEVGAALCTCVRSAYEGTRSWHDRIWAAGWAGMRFLQEDPQRARFLIVEVNGAGSDAQGRRDRLLQGLADLIDPGREELDETGFVSRSTAEIVAGAIYGTLLAKVDGGSIDRGEDFLPELVYMAVMPYLGSEAAEEELLVHTLR